MNPFEENTEQTQGSPAWKAARKGRVGGSSIPVILGISPYKTRYQLWLAHVTPEGEEDNLEGLPHIMRGRIAEPIARKKFEDISERKYTPTFWVKNDMAVCSDDGANLEHGSLLEIKAMGLEAHEAAKVGVIPAHYRAQIIWNMGISGMKTCFFISVRPEEDNEIVTVTVDWSEKTEATYLHYLNEAKAFIELVKTKVPPELCDKDAIHMDSEVFIADENAYVEAKSRLAEAQEAVDLAEGALLSYLGKHGSIEGSQVKVTRYSRKGSVSWAKIPEVKALPVDLIEKYRGAASVSTRITVKKEKANEEV